MLRKCAFCKIEKGTPEFGKKSQRKDGLDSYCRKCNAFRTREYREREGQPYKDRQKEYQKEYKLKNRDRLKQAEENRKSPEDRERRVLGLATKVRLGPDLRIRFYDLIQKSGHNHYFNFRLTSCITLHISFTLASTA